METGTFLEESVNGYFEKHLVPVMFRADKKPAQFLRFQVTESPTYIVLDSGGNELYRLSGHFTAEDLIEKLKNSV